MNKIGIVGLGLMGGSLAKSFAHLDDVDEIVAYDMDFKSLEKAKNEKIISKISYDIDENFENLDFIFICTPVNTIYEYAKKLKNIVKSDCIITDIGSTKKNIVEQIDELGINFVGAHPMIGSEKYGYQFSSDDLFTNSYYILTMTSKTKGENIKKLQRLIKKIGANPLIVNLDEHDFAVGAVSHVPHIVAAGLVNLVKKLDNENGTMKTIAAGGFKDITRIASANPHMWQNVCKQNKEQVVIILDQFKNIIESFKNNIEKDEEVYQYFETAKEYRDSFSTNHKIDYVTIETKDKIGVLADITTICSQNYINIRNIKLLRTKEKEEVIINILFENEKDRKKSIELFEKNKYNILS